MTRLPLQELGSSPRERRLLARLGVVLAAVVVGAGAGVSTYAWADLKLVRANERISELDMRLSQHLTEMVATRVRMDEYVREERAARCSIARNVYALCQRTAVVCEPVGAQCTK